jgi:beta-galactosidase GanA
MGPFRMSRRQALAVPAVAALAAAGLTSPAHAESVDTGTGRPVTFDPYSLVLDGRRTVVWSGEFHYWRLPSPGLWRDILEKMKAEGYNATSIYFNWAFHSPAPGDYDFTGIRDVDALLDMAEQAGLYVIARPGPYINGETNAGGFPGWLTTQAGKARSDASDYLAAVDEWLTRIDAILARHQYTTGGGTVILYQIENELAATGTAQQNYMQHLYDKVRADGLTVPIFHNDKGRNGIWVPPSSTVDGTVPGPVDLYAFDGYPGGSTPSDGSPGSPNAAPDWGIWGTGGATGGSSASPETPGFAAEFGGGWFDYWGSAGTYGGMALRDGPGYERVFYGTNIANRLTLQNFYMTFGGTSWGWLPAPVVYTSYDYGAAFDEARQIRPKATAMKLLGLYLRAVPEIAAVERGDAVTASSPAIRIYHDVSAGTHFYIAVHSPSNATTDDTFTFTVSTADGDYTVPQSGTLRLAGQDAKLLTAGYDFGDQHLVYSTSQLATYLRQDGADLALLYAPDGEDGETVLRYPSRPHVDVVAGDATVTYGAGDLRLNYGHHGLTEVRVHGGGRSPLTLLLADSDTAGTFWRQDTAAGPILESGPELVRGATVTGATLALRGDTDAATELRIWAPARVHRVTWNGTPVRTTCNGSLSASLPGPAAVTLPDLSAATWRTALESPESEPAYDDSGWAAADRTATNSTTQPPSGQPVLTADDYGFHQGDVWYRCHVAGPIDADALALRYGGGGAGLLQAWLDGSFLGQDVLSSGVSSPPTTGTVTFGVPAGLRGGGDHVLSVMVRNNGHNEDGGVNDAHKEGRGLISATWTLGGATASVETAWRIQGNLGGQSIVDTARGVMNSGGLYGERHGWHLPGFPDSGWRTASLPAGSAAPGTTWYRTGFRLDVPDSVDASTGITLGDPSTPRSDADYRALLFVNGWQVGQYIANVGPQHTFVVPAGVLNPHGTNTLALAVTSAGGAGNGPETVALTDLGTVRGGVPVTMNRAPSYDPAVYGRSAPADRLTLDSLATGATGTVHGGDTLPLTSTVSNRTAAAVDGLAVTLSVPDGWTATGGDAPTGLAAGASADVRWTVTIPADAAGGSYPLAARATAGNRTTGAVTTVAIQSQGDAYLSDLDWVSATSGWGAVTRDANVNGSALAIRGTGYAKGLGVNAASEIVYALDGNYTTFTADVGVDDTAGGHGSVTFTVLADGVQIAATGTMTGTTAA